MVEKIIKEKQKNMENFLNLIFRPWVGFVLMLGVIGLVSPYIYRDYIRSPTIEDCADLSLYNSDRVIIHQSWIKQTPSKKLAATDYEFLWEKCEKEKRQTPEKYNLKYKDTRKTLETIIIPGLKK